MSRRAVGVNSQLARFNGSETPPRSRGGVLSVEAHSAVHKFMINMIEWQLSPGSLDQRTTASSPMLGLNSLLISLGNPRNEITKDSGQHRVTLSGLRLSELKLATMKDFIFEEIEKEAAGADPTPPPKDESEWIRWGRSLIGGLEGSEAKIFDLDVTDFDTGGGPDLPQRVSARRAAQATPRTGRGTRASAAAAAAAAFEEEEASR